MLAIDENSKNIEASTLTDHLTSDASQVKPLLDNVDSEIGDVKADGAYDYDSVLQVGIGGQIDILIKILEDCFSSIILILKFGYHAISHSKERYKSL